MAGVSATAEHAACAKRFEEPITNVSKWYRSLSRLVSEDVDGGAGVDYLLGDEGRIVRAYGRDGSAILNSDGTWHRDVVLEEFNMRVANNPDARLTEQIMAAIAELVDDA